MKHTILIGGGCFWGVEAYYNKIKGVISTEVGYANGSKENPTYKEVCNDEGSVEVVKLKIDTSLLSLKELFTSFLHIIDPFSVNRQGQDVGIQYRTGLYSNDKEIISNLKDILKDWEKRHLKTCIEIKGIKNYFKAEEHHQEYLTKNKNGYCHINLNFIPNSLKK